MIPAPEVGREDGKEYEDRDDDSDEDQNASEEQKHQHVPSSKDQSSLEVNITQYFISIAGCKKFIGGIVWKR